MGDFTKYFEVAERALELSGHLAQLVGRIITAAREKRDLTDAEIDEAKAFMDDQATQAHALLDELKIPTS